METKYAYLAGIIDGEGTVNITYLGKRNEHRLRIYIVNTDKRLIDWLFDNFGGLVYLAKRHKMLHPTWKDKYEWIYVPSKDKLDILKSIIPFLVVKKEQMQIAIRFLETVKKTGEKLSEETRNIRFDLHSQLRKLNQGFAAATTE